MKVRTLYRLRAASLLTADAQVENPRVGMLSNHEVLAHITAMKERYTEQHQRLGGAHAMKAENLETVMKEVGAPPRTRARDAS